MIRERARETGAAFAVCNLVGAQDELVFDGHSVVVGSGGETLARAAQFSEELLVCDLELEPVSEAQDAGAARLIAGIDLPPPGAAETPARLAPILDPDPEVYAALALGL